MTPREQNDFVAEKLGLWKRGQKCDNWAALAPKQEKQSCANSAAELN